MRKITDPDYQLPEIIPFQWVRTLTSGANCPMLVRGVDLVNQTPGDFVLKYRGAERMDETASRRELVAAWIAAELDIWTPEPVLVRVLLAQNGDRRPEKPNSFLAEGRIYLIDHELAFGFLSMLPMFANPEPWILNETDVLAAKKHLFYPMLRQSKGVDWAAALGTLPNLTPQFWQRTAELLPDEWKNTGEINRIRDHFESIQQNTATFISEIWNKLIG